MNLALFIPYEQGVRYSQSMVSEMKIGNPVNYAYFNKLKRASLNLSIQKLPYELTQKGIAIGDFENQTPYTDIDFYDYDRCKIESDLIVKKKNIYKDGIYYMKFLLKGTEDDVRENL